MFATAAFAVTAGATEASKGLAFCLRENRETETRSILATFSRRAEREVDLEILDKFYKIQSKEEKGFNEGMGSKGKEQKRVL
jgi:hypothetical protein